MTHNIIRNLFETDWKLLSVKLASFATEKKFFRPTKRRKMLSNDKCLVSVNYQSLILSKYRVGEKDHSYDVKFLFLA